MEKASIQDVAKASGVSVATVSRVLNQPDSVSEETRNTVRKEMERLDYRPGRRNGVRKAKKNRCEKQRFLLVTVSDIGNPFFSDIISGIDTAAQKYGYTILVVPTYCNVEREERLLGLLDSGTVDGALLLASTLPVEILDDYYEKYPLIQCCDFQEESKAAHISIDNVRAASQVVEYLIGCGHRKIAMIGLANGFNSSSLRVKAYEKAMEQNGLLVEPGWIKLIPDTFDCGMSAAWELLKDEKGERPTAIFCASDIAAAGVLRTAESLGLKVPEDLALIGFDNTISRLVTPSLSTVAQPMKQMGETAVEMLMMKRDGKPFLESMYLEHELIIRKTN